MWEFAAVLYIMELFPDTLLYSGLFGFCETLTAVILGTHIGASVTKHNRKQFVRWTILTQNCSIVAAAVM